MDGDRDLQEERNRRLRGGHHQQDPMAGRWDTHRAAVCDTLGEVMDALTDDEGGLSRVCKEAIQAAAGVDEAFRALEYEDI